MRIPFSLFVRHTKERKEKRKHLCARVRNIFSEATTTSSKPPHIIFILSFSFFAGKMGRTKDVRLGPPTLTDRNWQGPRVRPGQIGPFSVVAPSTCQIELKGGLREVAAS